MCFAYPPLASSILKLDSDLSQHVCHPLNRRMGATAATQLHVTLPSKRSSSTFAMRATLWRQTTSSSPARTASGTDPCRSVVDLHKVCLSKRQISFCIFARYIFLDLSNFFFFFDHRQGAVFSTGDTGSVNCGFHSQLCGSYPAVSGAFRSCTAQTEVLSPQQVRYSHCLQCSFPAAGLLTVSP